MKALANALSLLLVVGCTAEAKKDGGDAKKPDPKNDIGNGSEVEAGSDQVIVMGQSAAISGTLLLDPTAFHDGMRYRASFDAILKLDADVKAKLFLKNLKTDCVAADLMTNSLNILHDESSMTTHAIGDFLEIQEYELGTLGAGKNTFNFMAMGAKACTFSFDLTLETFVPAAGDDDGTSAGPGDTGSGMGSGSASEGSGSGSGSGSAEPTAAQLCEAEGKIYVGNECISAEEKARRDCVAQAGMEFVDGICRAIQTPVIGPTDTKVIGSWAAASLTDDGFMVNQMVLAENGTGTVKRWLKDQSRLSVTLKDAETSADGKLSFIIDTVQTDVEGTWTAGLKVLCIYSATEKTRLQWRCSKPGLTNFPTGGILWIGMYHGTSTDGRTPYLTHKIYDAATLPAGKDKFIKNTITDEIVDFEINVTGEVLGIQIYAQAKLVNTNEIYLTINNLFDDRGNGDGGVWNKAQGADYHFFSMGYDTDYGGQFAGLTGTKLSGKWIVGYSNTTAHTETLKLLEVMIFGVK